MASNRDQGRSHLYRTMSFGHGEHRREPPTKTSLCQQHSPSCRHQPGQSAGSERCEPAPSTGRLNHHHPTSPRAPEIISNRSTPTPGHVPTVERLTSSVALRAAVLHTLPGLRGKFLNPNRRVLTSGSNRIARRCRVAQRQQNRLGTPMNARLAVRTVPREQLPYKATVCEVKVTDHRGNVADKTKRCDAGHCRNVLHTGLMVLKSGATASRGRKIPENNPAPFVLLELHTHDGSPSHIQTGKT